MLEHRNIPQRELILFYTKTALKRRTPPTLAITVDYAQPNNNHLHLTDPMLILRSLKASDTETHAPHISPKTEHFRLDYIGDTYTGKEAIIDHLREQGGGLALHIDWISKMKRPYEFSVIDTGLRNK